MPERVDFSHTGYMLLGQIPANRLPESIRRAFANPAPMVDVFSCIRCGAMVSGIAEAGRLTHTRFHRDLDQAGVVH